MIAPVFIVGPARSGTSFLCGLLNQHPGIGMLYESRLPLEGQSLYRSFTGTLDDIGQFNRLIDGILAMERQIKNRWFATCLNRNRTQLFMRHGACSDYADLLPRMFQLEGEKSCWGNKMLRAELIPEIRKTWPDARFILLLRDPRAVVASQLRRFKGRRIAYAALYCDTHLKWIETHATDPERFLTVPYETFVNEPFTSLERILRFMNVWDPLYARHMLFKKPANNNSVDLWRSTLTRGQIGLVESVCYDRMIRAGYIPEVAGAGKKLGRIRRALEVGIEKREALGLQPSVWKEKKLVQRLLCYLNF